MCSRADVSQRGPSDQIQRETLQRSAEQQVRLLWLHSVNFDDLDSWILRQPGVSLLFRIPLIGAQNEMFFHDVTHAVRLI
jgi:hypothetical protein